MHKTDHYSYWGAFFGFFGSLTLSDWGVIISILVAVATLLINWAYKSKEFKLKERELELKYKDNHE
ncbi:phage holin family protein [Actinobacillus equuli subsp. haemolyticus]|uniref:HP1 family phage holin n=1 Tax=Actinobacillus equuli TaxID=718 RepID=UPI00241895C8|nr:HP1 family phage holin [Actinobacillus equuli]MDG4948710.1 phage holin family protein [Actinobacillus equuli subsp. haemolyticus]WGE63796.1 phage holin family protein [Actinobacillus equuli subsp. haemolyticus]